MSIIADFTCNLATISGSIEAWETDVNTEANTSVVHARVKLWRNNSYSGSTYSGSVTRSLTINGIQVAAQTAGLTVPPTGGEVTVIEGQTTVAHNADGGKTVAIAYNATDNVYAADVGKYIFTANASGTLTLTKIARDTLGLYAVVNSKTRRVKKLYVVVNGKTRKVKKLYAVVNGATKLVYKKS